MNEEICKLAVQQNGYTLQCRSVYNWYMFFLIIKKNIK
jgi:hypothetical protein